MAETITYQLDQQTTQETKKVSRLRRLLTVGIATLTAAGCLPKGTEYQGPGNGITVAVMGDSQPYLAEHNQIGDNTQRITDLLTANNYRVSTSLMPGAMTFGLNPFKGWSGESPPEINVIALGVNDLSNLVPFEEIQTNVRSYLDQTGAGCYVLIETPKPDLVGLDVTGAELNAFFAQEVAARNGVLLNWSDIVAEHPEYLISDGIHATNEGKIAYRNEILNSVGECALKLS